MCDYSLEAVKSRAAEDNEDLILKRFSSGSQGFVSAEGDQDCAVCCKTGVEVRIALEARNYQTRSLENNADRETFFFEGEIDATFHTLEGQSFYAYKDGLVLPNGHFLSLQSIPPGTRATVTKALPKEIADAAKAETAFEPEIRVSPVEVAAPETVA